MAMLLHTQPSFPRGNLAPLTWARPSSMETAIGVAYDTVREMTPTPEKAMKAVYEPK